MGIKLLHCSALLSPPAAPAEVEPHFRNQDSEQLSAGLRTRPRRHKLSVMHSDPQTN